MNTIAPSSLIGSPSNLQVTREGMNARTSSNSCQIRPVSLELLALDRLKKCKDDSAFIFDRTSLIFGPNRTIHL